MSCALVIVLLLLGSPERAAELVAQAAEARAAGRLGESLELMRQAYGQDPSPILLNNIAVLLETLGRYREALETYQRVVSDAAAPAELVELDRARILRLTPLSARAWLWLEAEDANARAWVDGMAVGLRVEVELAPGPHRLEVWSPGGAELSWSVLSLTAGVLERWHRKAQPEAARVWVDRVTPPLVSLEVDGARLEGFSRAVRSVLLPPGPHRVRAVPFGEAAHDLDLVLEPKSARALFEAPQVVVQTPPTSARGSAGPPWAWIGLGTGAVLLGASAISAWSAGQDRATVRGAARDMQGVVIGLSFAEAGALESQANLKSNLALGLGLAGAAAVVAGALTWILEDADAP
ncbi:MAG: hypothetical protein U1E65_35270 [Myxococcota bacterium]